MKNLKKKSTSKKTVSRVKRQTHKMGGNIANHISEKGLVSRICKELTTHQQKDKQLD